MRTRIVASALLALTLAAPSFAETRWNIGISIGDAPPPPRVVYRHPHWQYMSDPGVYVIDEEELPYDMFMYGGYYYIYNDGYWYRCASARGRFTAIHAEYVPQPIWRVTYHRDYRWRHRPDVPPRVAYLIENRWRPNDGDRGYYRDQRRRDHDGDRDRDRGRDRDRHRDRDRGHDSDRD